MMNNFSRPARRFPAEWETGGAIMLSWPHAETDWVYMLEEVTDCFVRIAQAITEFHNLIVVAPDIEVPKRCLASLSDRRIFFCQVETNDTWARDFGPITVFDGDKPVVVDFKFNGWGLKFPACYDNLVTSKLCSAGLFTAQRENRLGFVLEGGSIESDGEGTLMTTSECLLSPNRNGDMSRQQIEDYLKDALGCDRILWVDHGFLAGDDTDSHIDTLARLAPHETILYVKSADPTDIHHEALEAMESDLVGFIAPSGNPYNLVGLPMADPVVVDGERLPATYANFLVTPRVVIMPIYAQPKNDMLAEQIIRIAFPDHEIRCVDCRPLIKQHGSLHCVTMQLPAEILPI